MELELYTREMPYVITMVAMVAKMEMAAMVAMGAMDGGPPNYTRELAKQLYMFWCAL